MATHKVPQDVEADDKIIGPFGLRQIMYLLVGAGAGFLAFMLATRVAIPLGIIPLPFAFFFVVIALPLRKEQPTEIYLAAVVKYFLKPHLRIWVADGEAPLVEISAPVTERPAIKDLGSDEVSRRLSFLTDITDTQGWSTRGYSTPVNNTNLNDDYVNDAVNAPDMLEGGALNDAIGVKLAESDKRVRDNAIKEMRAAAQPAPASEPPTVVSMAPATNSVATEAPTPTVASLVSASNLASPASEPTSVSYGYSAPSSAPDIEPDLQAAVVAPQHNIIQPISNQPAPASAPAPQPTVPPILQSTPKPVTSQKSQSTVEPESEPIPPSAPEPAIIENDNPVIDIKFH